MLCNQCATVSRKRTIRRRLDALISPVTDLGIKAPNHEAILGPTGDRAKPVCKWGLG